MCRASASSSLSLSSPNTPSSVRIVSGNIRTASSSFFRILVNERTIKYLTVTPWTDITHLLHDHAALITHLSRYLPSQSWAGHWNFALYQKLNQCSDEYTLKTRTAEPIGSASVWADVRLDWRSLTSVHQYKHHVHEVQCSAFPGRTVIVKFMNLTPTEGNRHENELIRQETMIYNRIEGHGIAPKFLGHLMEGDRGVGFFLEKLQGRPAHYTDSAVCETVLRRLHGLCIKHGDVQKHNFVVAGDDADRRAFLIDFEHSSTGRNSGYREEFERLPSSLI